eukprot:tig00000144_g9156.t1
MAARIGAPAARIGAPTPASSSTTPATQAIRNPLEREASAKPPPAPISAPASSLPGPSRAAPAPVATQGGSQVSDSSSGARESLDGQARKRAAASSDKPSSSSTSKKVRGNKDEKEAAVVDQSEGGNGDQESVIRMRDIIRDAKSQITASKASRSRAVKEQEEPKSPKSPSEGPRQNADDGEASEKANSSEQHAGHGREDSRGKFAPQVQVINGRIVVNEESLVVDASEDADTSKFEEVHETNSYVNAMSFRKTVTPTDRWGVADTALFFKALRLFGSDFSMIEKVFPNRTRRQIRNKFKKEEREHKDDINDILNNKRPLDAATAKILLAELRAKCPKTPTEPAPSAKIDQPVAEEHAEEEMTVQGLMNYDDYDDADYDDAW